MTMRGRFYSDNLKGKVEISSLDKLHKGIEQDIRINISVRNGTMKKLEICTKHTVGVIYIIKPEIELKCSNWQNFTKDDNGNQVNLTNNIYFCPQTNSLQ